MNYIKNIITYCILETPMGTLPIMKVGSDVLVSSLAMLTYLGAEAGILSIYL